MLDFIVLRELDTHIFFELIFVIFFLFQLTVCPISTPALGRQETLKKVPFLFFIGLFATAEYYQMCPRKKETVTMQI